MKQFELSQYLETAKEAALQAGRFLLDGLGKCDIRVEYKGEFDLVTEMDRRAEEQIKETLVERFPEASVLAEEGGVSGNFNGIRWLIDPLDGTTSYAHSLPHFSVSIALEVDGEIELGVVYNPCLDECFSAVRGGGAFLNEKKIKVSGRSELKDSLLATGFPYDRAVSSDNNLKHFNNFMLKIQCIRRMGSAAIDLCYTAAGRFDGFWEMKLKPWDCAAGLLMVEEAGGMVTDFGGGSFSIYGKELLASNGLIHNDMIKVLKVT